MTYDDSLNELRKKCDEKGVSFLNLFVAVKVDSDGDYVILHSDLRCHKVDRKLLINIMMEKTYDVMMGEE